MSDVEPPRGRVVPREIGRAGDGEGPVLLVVAGLHGNEPSGVEALERVFAALARDGIRVRGRFVGLAGNRGALAVGERFLEEDLNRVWSIERVERLRDRANGVGPEATEQRELLDALSRELEGVSGPAHLLDLHTTSSRSVPFYILGDTLRNREFARHFPAMTVLGLDDHIRGTLMEYFTTRGHVAVAIEGGRHDDPASVEHHEAAIWLALADIGCVDAAGVPDRTRHHERLGRGWRGFPRVVEIFHRHPLSGDEGFRMDDGYANFHRVRRGQRLATDRQGEVRAPADGLLFLPLYQKRGDDGFFLARAVHPLRLAVSAAMRRLGLPRVAPRLPGIRVHPDRKDTLVVDLRVARFYAQGIFHLLGYRVELGEERHLVVQRRPGG